MRKLLLITLSALIIASGFFVFAGNEAFAISSNMKCYDASDGTRNIIDQDVWSRFVKVSVPIPGVTKELVCLGTQQPYVDIEVDRYYYATDLGTYLAGFYQFFVSIVGILAAIMIMYAGIQWVLAAGNQSRIQSAKNIIFSAVIGVVIAFTSYLLLFLLNPALINYDSLNATLSSIALDPINQESEVWCDSLIDEQTLPDRSQAAQILYPDAVGLYGSYYPALFNSRGVPIQTYFTPAKFVSCGDTATLTSDNATKCVGSYCGPDGGLCIQKDYNCVKGAVAGTLSHTSNAYVDAIALNAVCNDKTWLNDPSVAGVASNIKTSLGDSSRYYALTNPIGYDALWDIALAFETDCNDGNGGLAGFILNIEINDDQGPGFNIFPTKDDNFAVGRDCTVIHQYKDPKEFTPREWERVIALNNEGERRLFSLEDLKIGGINNRENFGKDPYICNFKIDRINFPAR